MLCFVRIMPLRSPDKQMVTRNKGSERSRRKQKQMVPMAGQESFRELPFKRAAPPEEVGAANQISSADAGASAEVVPFANDATGQSEQALAANSAGKDQLAAAWFATCSSTSMSSHDVSAVFTDKAFQHLQMQVSARTIPYQ